MNHDCEQQAVQDRLEALYEADGRHDPAHPMHGLYTGLAQAAQQEEVEGGVLTDPRMIQCFVIGFFANPILWIAIHHLINRK